MLTERFSLQTAIRSVRLMPILGIYYLKDIHKHKLGICGTNIGVIIQVVMQKLFMGKKTPRKRSFSLSKLSFWELLLKSSHKLTKRLGGDDYGNEFREELSVIERNQRGFADAQAHFACLCG